MGSTISHVTHQCAFDDSASLPNQSRSTARHRIPSYRLRPLSPEHKHTFSPQYARFHTPSECTLIRRIGSRCYGRWGRMWLTGQNDQCWSRSSTIMLSAPTYQGIECLDVHFVSAKSVRIGEQRIYRHQTDIDRMPRMLRSINNLVSSASIVVVCLTWIPLPR